MRRQIIKDIYQHNLLADAAYLDWSKSLDIDAMKLLLKLGRNFNERQSSDFADKYIVIKHQENKISGFSATLFEDELSHKQILAIRGTEPKTAADLLTDLDLALISGLATFQYEDLKQFVGELKTSGVLNSSITLTGHSLGGHLAMKFALDDSLVIQDLVTINHTYTYNAPGMGTPLGGGLLTNLLEFLGASSTQPNDKITNYYGTGGIELATGGCKYNCVFAHFSGSI